ncbi:hypothetical protein [Aureimonas psammosilenae]|uniref:hypothetical protein n=1 Tax=Aureimonas psammosilenae TaxID=2495496 RepID=UPI0012609AC2|nr:hypothetical protein [Aureimonas psammosilenae]
MAELSPADAEAQVAFEVYTDAQARMLRTMRPEDGIAAGRAYRRFLDVFLTPDQRRQLDAANIVPFRRSA